MGQQDNTLPYSGRLGAAEGCVCVHEREGCPHRVRGRGGSVSVGVSGAAAALCRAAAVC